MDSTHSSVSATDKPFVLAAFFDGVPTHGGSYVHRRGMLKVLRRVKDSGIAVIVICDTADAAQAAKAEGLDSVVQRRNLFARVRGSISASETVKVRFGRSWARRLSPLDRLLTRMGVDLVLFTGHDARASQLYSHNYIFSVMDLCHLEHPEFPEVAHFGEFERRERLFRRVLQKAVAVIADSETGRSLIAQHYGVSCSRVFAAPFLVSEHVGDFEADSATAARVRERYGIVQPYIFYPAQFWPHKNHRYVLDAMATMRRKFGWAPQAVFCGSDKGNLRAVLEHAERLQLTALIKCCGFVPGPDMPYLYQAALALVMPTYFGPTNIPPMEALALGVPVCYSDFPSFREQLGTAAYYVDLARPESLADVLQAIRTSDAGGKEQREDRKARLLAQQSRYVDVLEAIIAAYRQKVPPVSRPERA